MDEIALAKRFKYAGDVYKRLLEGGFDIDNAVLFLEGIPDADVAPVRHGHWVSLTDCSNAGVYCSNCHKKVYKEDYASCNRKNKLRSNYCPNCGADMR